MVVYVRNKYCGINLILEVNITVPLVTIVTLILMIYAKIISPESSFMFLELIIVDEYDTFI